MMIGIITMTTAFLIKSENGPNSKYYPPISILWKLYISFMYSLPNNQITATLV